MLKVIEGERVKLAQQKQVLLESRNKLIAKKKLLSEQKQMLATAAKSLSRAEEAFEKKLDEMETINKVLGIKSLAILKVFNSVYYDLFRMVFGCVRRAVCIF